MTAMSYSKSVPGGSMVYVFALPVSPSMTRISASLSGGSEAKCCAASAFVIFSSPVVGG